MMSQILLHQHRQLSWLFKGWPNHHDFMLTVDLNVNTVLGKTGLVIDLEKSDYPDFVQIGPLTEPHTGKHGHFLDLTDANMALVAAIDGVEHYVLFSIFDNGVRLAGTFTLETGDGFTGEVLVGEIRWIPDCKW